MPFVTDTLSFPPGRAIDPEIGRLLAAGKTAEGRRQLGVQQGYVEWYGRLDPTFENQYREITSKIGGYDWEPVSAPCRRLVAAMQAGQLPTIVDAARVVAGDAATRSWEDFNAALLQGFEAEPTFFERNTIAFILWQFMKAMIFHQPRYTSGGVHHPDGSHIDWAGMPDGISAAYHWSMIEQYPWVIKLRGAGQGWICGHQLRTPAAAYREHVPLGDNPLDAAAAGLIREAIALRRGTIPDGAVVEINYPPIVAVQLWERPNGQIHALFVDNQERLLPVELDPRRASIWGMQDVVPSIPDAAKLVDVLHDGTPRQLNWDTIFAPLRAMLAAIVRDFWVVEDRERVFGPPKLRHILGARRKSDRRVIYLPRVRYVGGASFADRVQRATANSIRRAAWVQSHLRKLPPGQHTSPLQILLAQYAGMTVPSGHTFVQAHERLGDAGGEPTTVYRARSVVRLALDFPNDRDRHLLGIPSWLAFEDSVTRLVEARGWRVQTRRKAIAGSGDDGVDILALVSGSAMLAVIQAKYWRKPVGPNVVREVAGAMRLQNAEVGVVAALTFSSAAVQTAAALGIQLWDGDQILGRPENVKKSLA